jgi:hypothetical protein
MKLERKVEQRLKMLREYEYSDELLRKKIDKLLKREEVLNLMPKEKRYLSLNSTTICIEKSELFRSP